jgi:HPt (histidine-containing phosphotransfer) domain-containing protein
MVLSAHLPNSQMEVQKEDGDYQIQSASDTAAPMELFDTATGMEYCLNDKDFYRETLEVFGQEHDAKAAEIATYYEAADWKLFTVRVHGLKSTARTVGALKLSELAKELEMAGKKLQEDPQHEETLTFVREKLPELYDLYQRTVAAIAQLKL